MSARQEHHTEFFRVADLAQAAVVQRLRRRFLLGYSARARVLYRRRHRLIFRTARLRYDLRRLLRTYYRFEPTRYLLYELPSFDHADERALAEPLGVLLPGIVAVIPVLETAAAREAYRLVAFAGVKKPCFG